MNKPLIWIFSLSLLASCSGGQPDKVAAPAADAAIQTDGKEKNEKNTKSRIVFFGDSLTAAYGLDEADGYTAHIQHKIDSMGLPYEVVNAGLSGETTAGGLTRIDWILESPLDIFVLELGGNDVLRGFDLTTTRNNLQAIVDKVKGKYPEARIIIAGMEAPPNMGAAYTNEFRSIFRDLSQRNDLPLIPFLLEGVGGHPELNLPDLIHPNEKGQVIVAENVWKVLLPVL